MRNRKAAYLSALLAALLLSSCTSPVGRQDTGIDVPLSWIGLHASATATPETPLAVDSSAHVEHDWWTHFGDPTLDAVIAEAIANNKTLQIAKARVEEARANRGVARASLFPDISGGASASRGNQGYLTSDKTIGIAGAEFDASWEVDVFGRNQARTAEATAIVESEEANSKAVRIGLLAEIGRNYFDMRNDERQIALTRQNLETQKKTLELTKVQLQSGFRSCAVLSSASLLPGGRPRRILRRTSAES